MKTEDLYFKLMIKMMNLLQLYLTLNNFIYQNYQLILLFHYTISKHQKHKNKLFMVRYI